MTIRKIEADERRPSRQLAERLAQHLALPSEERAAFLKAVRAERSPDRLAAPIPPYDPAPARYGRAWISMMASLLGKTLKRIDRPN